MTQLALYEMPKKECRRVAISVPIPKWLPPSLALWLRQRMAERPEGKLTVATRFSNGERAAMKRRRPVPISAWAEKHRVLEMSAIRGRWRNVFTPYLTGIMDVSGLPGVETVIICKSPQTGGSECGHNIVGYCIDRLPGPVMYVFPDELTARENAKDRIIPMIEASPRLRQYMTGYGDDASSLRINLLHMPIYLGWSGSVSRLGNKPIRILILDELDKYKNPKNEASSESLAEKRTTTWRTRRKVVKISTPTTDDGPIWKALTEEAGARFDFWVRCPHCGFFQHMDFERIAWPGKDEEKSPDAETVLAKRLATYACEYCGTVWDDGDRDRAVRGGEWRERTSGLELMAHVAAHRPVKVGFHIPAWLSYFVSLSEVAHAWLKYKESGKLDDLKNFRNQYAAEPWVESHAARSEDAILALCDDRPRGKVPGPVDGKERVSVLLATVDTQQHYFRYVIRAYGYGETEESWIVASGSADNLAALEEILFGSVYADPDGREYAVKAAMIDAMGGRTAEVYRWAVRHRGRVFPWQGVRSMAQPYTPSHQEYFPDAKGNKVKIPGGLMLYRCDVTFFKSDLAFKLGIHPDDPGAFHLHANDGGQLEQYAKELCAEVWDDEKQGWENPANKPNHFWDCEVMQRAFAFILNVRHRRRPGEEAKKPARPPRPSERGGGGGRDRFAPGEPAEVVMALYDLADRLNWQQACEILGCSKAQLYRLVKEKKIPVYGTGKRYRWYLRTDLKLFLETGYCEKNDLTN